MENLICKIFGHKYYIIREYSPSIRKLGCRRCNKVWGMNDRVKALIEWDGELEELYENSIMTLEKFINKFVEQNTIIRLWEKIPSGHRPLNDGITMMEWELIKTKYAKREVIGITDILVIDRYSEAVNIVLRS